MSSLAAARADNFYYPPEWSPDQGGLNKYHNSHPLGKRAKDIDKGILVIRFEMPWAIWCNGCKAHIGRGVRYNAKKQHVGDYFSTKIFENREEYSRHCENKLMRVGHAINRDHPCTQFRMTCHLCAQEIAIRTDPEHRDYLVVSGAKRKTETFDVNDTETMELLDKDEKAYIAANAMRQLDYDGTLVKRSKEDAPRLVDLVDLQSRNLFDYDNARVLRKVHRDKKKANQQRDVEAAKLGFKFQLQPSNEEDALLASATTFRTPSASGEALKRVLLSSGSIFDTETTKDPVAAALAKDTTSALPHHEQDTAELQSKRALARTAKKHAIATAIAHNIDPKRLKPLPQSVSSSASTSLSKPSTSPSPFAHLAVVSKPSRTPGVVADSKPAVPAPTAKRKHSKKSHKAAPEQSALAGLVAAYDSE